jgi:hypothetical protein
LPAQQATLNAFTGNLALANTALLTIE